MSKVKKLSVLGVLISTCLGGIAMAQDAAQQLSKQVSKQENPWFEPVNYQLNAPAKTQETPFIMKGLMNGGSVLSSDYAWTTDSNRLNNESMTFSVPDKDLEGQWLLSFDVNGAQSSKYGDNDLQAFSLGSAYVADNSFGTSKFFVNYGNRKVPISISVDKSFEMDMAHQQQFGDVNGVNTFGQLALSDEKRYQLGFEQSFNENWAVSISYQKNDLNVMSTQQILQPTQSFDQPESYQFLFDFNQDGSPGTVNLLSQLPKFNSLDRDFDGIEIKVSRVIGENVKLSSALGYGEGNLKTSLQDNLQATPFLLNLPEEASNHGESFNSSHVSLMGDININQNWSFGTELKHKQNQYFSIGESVESLAELDSTTLDIGLQYQNQLNKVGFVIRIDLMNLLGVTHTDNMYDPYSQNLDDRGLMPYTFQTPKYLKLSGSINF